MSRLIEMPDGSIRRFPDDATDEEIKQALLAEMQERPQNFEPQPESAGFLDSLSHNVAQPFNRGLLSLPSMLPGGDAMMQSAEKYGLVDPAGEGATGPIARGSEILGSAALPFGGIAGYGAKALSGAKTAKTADQLWDMAYQGRPRLGAGVPSRVQPGHTGIPAQQGVMQNIATQTAQRPVTSAGAEALASYGAGVGGEAMPEDPLTGELIGGGIAALTPLAVINSPSMLGAKWLGSKMPTFGGKARAAKSMQADTSDPVAAAGKLDPPEFDAEGNVIQPMPSARQIGEPRVLARERQLRQESSPQQAEQIEQHIKDTVDRTRREAIGIEGDPAAARSAVRSQVDDVVMKVRNQAEEASRELDESIAQMGVNDDPAAISQAARDKIDEALKAASRAEKEAWSEVGFDSPGDYSNTRNAIDEIVSNVGRAERGDVIPPFVAKELEAEMVEGAVTTLRDIHSLRRKVQALKGAALRDPEKRPMVKWLGELEDSLLADMNSVKAANPDALAAARQKTAEIYSTFRRGNLGRILGNSERGVERVVDADTLREVVSGKDAARNIGQFIEAAPDAEDNVRQFLRRAFAKASTKQGKFNRASANTFIANLRERRVFEALPGLEDDLVNATSAAKRAELAGKRSDAVEKNVNKFLASQYSDEGASVLFDAKNPVLTAKRLKTRMRGNEAAEKGLQRDFTESLWARSQKSRPDVEGEDVVDVGMFNKLTKEHEDTMRSLGMSDEQIRSIKELGKKMQQAQAKPRPGDAPSEVFDPYGWLLNRVSAITGARSSSWLNRLFGGKGAGVSLQAAQMGASAGRQASGALHIDPARKLMLEAMDNPELMRDLLLYKQVNAKAQKQARAKLNAWLIGQGLEPLGEEDWEDSE